MLIVMNKDWKFKQIDREGKNRLFQSYVKNNITKKYDYLVDILSDSSEISDLIDLGNYYKNLCETIKD